MIYRVQGLPDPQRTCDLLRSECRDAGMPEPIIGKFDTHGNFDDPAAFGCDVAAQFPPHGVGEHVSRTTVPGCDPGNLVFDYAETVRVFSTLERPSWTRFPGVFPSWDNSPRRADGGSLLFVGNNPDAYERWLTAALAEAEAQGPGTPVFVNAWNEWAEGAHLEPDDRHGRAFLEATARATLGDAPSRAKPSCSATDPIDMPTFADLYLDLYEDYVRLQRSMTGLLATFERQVALAAQEERDRLRGVLDDATQLEQEVRRLQSELRGRRPAGS
jgi:Glycosyltransferase WbsX